MPDRAAIPLDLEGYFARIDYAGPRTPTIETLQAITLAHVTALPFNNLDILLGRPIPLDPVSLQRKLIDEGRGGYCFEQNGLLQLVLTALGFRVTPLGGRARTTFPRRIEAPRTHYFLRVDIGDTPWLVDVGFGGLSLTAAIRLQLDIAQPTPHETRRIVRENGRMFHQALLNGGWNDAVEFTLEPMPPIDRELANWWTSTHPTSTFKSRLIVARAGPAGTRLTIADRQFKIRRADGTGDTQDINSPAHLLAILAEHFGLRYPPGTRFEVPALVW